MYRDARSTKHKNFLYETARSDPVYYRSVQYTPQLTQDLQIVTVPTNAQFHYYVFHS
jgi:hypothetical protein